LARARRRASARKELSIPDPQVLLEGVAFGESPRWHDDRLWFSDWGAQQVVAVDEAGNEEVIAQVDFPAFPMCIEFAPDGRLLVVAGRDGRLLRREPDGSLAAYADLTPVSTRPWNDIVVDGAGNAYVGNIGFDFPGGEFAPGTVALVSPDGAARQVADGLAFPNGVAITPGDGTLIVAESYGERLTAFEIGDDGGLRDRRVWAETPGDHPDGICVDSERAVWYADVANKHCVRVREGGQVLDVVDCDRGCFACVLGGADGSTLFIVAQEWGGPQSMRQGVRTGQVLTAPAPASRAGRP
jgi:sugar lactone lactonase YvrE